MADYHALTLGALPISGPGSQWIESDGGYQIRTLGTDANFGNPEPIISEIPSGLEDGSLERIDAWTNREPTFQVAVRAMDARGLARGEADLVLACRDTRTLTWVPPAEWGVETIHDVRHARIEDSFDDVEESEEQGMPTRIFNLRVVAGPFPRSATEVVVPALGDGSGTSTFVPTVTVIAEGTDAYGWGTSQPGGVEFFGSTVSNSTYSPMWVPRAELFLVPGVYDLAGDRMIRLQFSYTAHSGSPASPSGPTLIYGADSGTNMRCTPVAVVDDYAYYQIDSLATEIYVLSWEIPPEHILIIREVARSNGMPYSSTGRQVVRQFDVQGTARTQGSLQLAHETLPLGQTLIYTWRPDASGYVPPISDRLASGPAPVTDAAAAVGRHLPLSPGSPAIFDVPALRLPEGTYSVLVRARRATAGAATVRVTASTRVGGVDTGIQSEQAYLSWATTYRVLSVGQMALPPTALPRAQTSATVRITISLPVTGETLLLDEVYLCNVDTGDLTLLDCGAAAPSAGGSSSRAWINSPDAITPRPTIYVGTLADQSDARHIAGTDCLPALAHQWAPGAVSVLTVSNAFDLAVSLRYHPRFQHNAMEVAP